MNKVEISILIPVYNAGRYIYQSIQSCIKQSFSDFEIIIIDDASTDNTKEIVNTIEDARIRMVSLQDNRGPAAARNLGLKMARGRWIAVLDADDTWHHDRLSILYGFANRMDERTVLFDEIQSVFQDKNGKLRNWRIDNSSPCEKSSNKTIVEISAVKWIKDNISAQPFFSRALVVDNDISYPDGIRFGEDFFFLAKILNLENVKLYQVCKPLYYRLIRVDSLTAASNRLEYRKKAYDLLLADNQLKQSFKSAVESRKENLRVEKKYQKFKNLVKNKSWLALVSYIIKNPYIIYIFIKGLPFSLSYRLRAFILGSKVR